MFRSSQRRIISRVLRINADAVTRDKQASSKVRELSTGSIQYRLLHRLLSCPESLGPVKQHLDIRKMSSSSEVKDHDDESLIYEASLPNDTWTEKTLKFYNELTELCKDGKWEKIKSFKNYSRDERLFVRAVDTPGKQFEYASFFNREEKCLRTVMQFGPWLQGPKGAVHGGAIATVFDSVTGVLIYNLGYRCATVNLNVDFHGFLPIYTTAECKAWISKIEGRKIYTTAELTSVDGKHVFDRCTALWLAIGSTDEEILKEQIKIHHLDENNSKL